MNTKSGPAWARRPKEETQLDSVQHKTQSKRLRFFIKIFASLNLALNEKKIRDIFVVVKKPQNSKWAVGDNQIDW